MLCGRQLVEVVAMGDDDAAPHITSGVESDCKSAVPQIREPPAEDDFGET